MSSSHSNKPLLNKVKEAKLQEGFDKDTAGTLVSQQTIFRNV
jgi:hypothetical protein